MPLKYELGSFKVIENGTIRQSIQSAIVIIALSCTIFELFDIEEYRDLEIYAQGHWKQQNLTDHIRVTVTVTGNVYVIQAFIAYICGACRRKWQLTDTDLCPCGETMSHIVESCPLTKLNGGLSRLHSADEDAVSWLTNYGK